jgi:molybdenum cofactor biosynthesis enzyme MoaA
MTLCTYSKTWVTVDLNNRSVGACCRTPQHDVDTDIDINDEWFKSLRNNLDNGILDERCQVCWHQDKTIGTSLRHYGPALKDEKVHMLSSGKGELQYLEIRLGNQCDGACVYCGGEFSAKQAKFWKIHLDIPKPDTKEPLLEETKRLIEQNKHTLNTIVFIGGEPSIMERWYDFIEFISNIQFENSLSVVITTNASWTEKTKQRLFTAVDKFLTGSSHTFNIRISGEGNEEYFNGIRKFTDYQRVLSNINDIAAKFHNRISYTLQPVLNGLSVYSLDDWIDKFDTIFTANNISDVRIHFALLTRPNEFQTMHQGNMAVPAIDKLIQLIQSSKSYKGKRDSIKLLENQRIKLVDTEPNQVMLTKLSRLLEAHDAILPNDWKSEDALSPIKHTL